MGKILIVYASMSGNTEEIANAIADGIREAGAEFDMKQVLDINASELEQYEGVLLGSYTWGDGELADEFLDFYEDMDQVDLSGKKAAAFGSGDHSYEHFCAAVDILEEKLKQLGAEVVGEGIKIELAPSDKEKEWCKDFGKKFAMHLVRIG